MGRINYFTLAKPIAEFSPCKRVKYGCVIAKDNQIISIGFNAPLDRQKKCKICCRVNKPHGKDYDECCPAIHAEEWAIVNAINMGRADRLEGADVYISGIGMPKGAKPCYRCMRLMKAVGINKVFMDVGDVNGESARGK